MSQLTNLSRKPDVRFQERHHLAFARRWYLDGGTSEAFRNLKCLMITADELAHDLAHEIYSPPQFPDPELMTAFINRHRAHLCGCFRLNQIVACDLLNLKGNGFRCDLPCRLGWVDRAVLRDFVLPHYRQPNLTRIDSYTFELFSLRHSLGTCACAVPWSAGNHQSRQLQVAAA